MEKGNHVTYLTLYYMDGSLILATITCAVKWYGTHVIPWLDRLDGGAAVSTLVVM